MKKIFVFLACISLVFASCLDVSGPYDIASETTKGTDGTSVPGNPSWGSGLEELFVVPSFSTSLADGEWQDGSLDAEAWYKISVSNGQVYYFWTNGSGTNGSAFDPKTGNPTIAAYYADGKSITLNGTNFWTTSRYFTAEQSGDVYIKATAANGTTYGIVYTEDNSDRPLVELTFTPIELGGEPGFEEEDWIEGEIYNSGDTDWYSLEVEDGTDYYFWFDTSYQSGNGTGNYTGNIRVDFYDEDSVVINTSPASTNPGYNNSPYSWTADFDGTLYIRVEGYDSGVGGTYALLWTTDPAFDDT